MMRRRSFVGAVAAGAAAQALQGQQPPQPANAQPVPLPANAADSLPILKTTPADLAADGMPRFFTAPQFGALRKLSMELNADAFEAKTPEFLDFLLSESLPEKQRVYREGLDALNAQSMKSFSKPFADLDNTQTAGLLAPLRKPWTFEEPTDPVGRFLRAAKVDVRVATVNSAHLGAGRRFVGSGQYWFPLD